jgi:glycosyltransferase involved in cell wall biosynthesis
MEQDIVVSVCMITYNHERYIEEAIDSVLSQKTNFHYRLVIGEDYGPDSTRQICERYAEKYPSKIKLLSSEKNLGMQPNFVRTLMACTGEYVALCEGDDFWCDENKLQKQYDILNANRELAISVHETQILYSDNTTQLLVKPIYKAKSEYSQKEMLEAVLPAYQTTSLFFRQIKEYPEWLNHSIVGDIPVFLLAVLQGKLHYSDEVMSVYRVHNAGISSVNNYTTIAHQKEIQQIYDKLLPSTPESLVPPLKKGKKGRIAKYYQDLYYASQGKNRVRTCMMLIPLFFIGKDIDLSIKDVLWLAKQSLLNK